MTAVGRGPHSGEDLHRSVRRGLAWSTVSNLTSRVGSLLVGICLARMLAPEEFGVYAVALTVQSILMTLADMGLSADLIRSAHPEVKIPTVATLGLLCGTTLAAVMIATAQPLADVLGSSQSAGPIQVLALTLVVAGAGVVPYAMLTRAFAQQRIFAVSLVDFAVGTGVTLSLVVFGWGAMALALGRLVAAVTAVIVQFRLAEVRPRYGLDAAVLPGVLRFGLPVAAANLLSWALLSIDTVVIARFLGSTQLGFYVLAFNISTWPMTALGQIVRSVALPGFARVTVAPGGAPDGSLARFIGPVWAFALLGGGCLALLASPLIRVVYGGAWMPAVPVLAALGIFGAIRVAFDLCASYLLARGAARATLVVQIAWILALVPATVIGVRLDGIRGAGWAHVVVAIGVIAPAYLVAIQRCGADVVAVVRALWPPLLAAVPAGAALIVASSAVSAPVARLLIGGAVGAGVYIALMYRWVRPRLPRSAARPSADVPGEHPTDLPAGPPTDPMTTAALSHT